MEISTRTPDLIGRQAELELVWTWADMLTTGPAGLVIRGEAGIGKTIVWTAAASIAAEHGARVLVTRPVEAEIPLGYAGLGDLLGSAAESVIGELPEPQAQALAAALSLGAASSSEDPLLVGRATLAVLGRLATASPVVIAIDDVQWLDSASARALAFAARRLGDLPVGFALTLRTDHQEPLRLASAVGDRSLDLLLGGLSVGAMGHLLRSRVDRDLPRRTVIRIHERSAGNPFFAVQLIDAGDGDLPVSLGDLVRRRLESVTPRATRAIELVAVLGPSAISAFDDLAALDDAVTAGILVEQDGRIRFAHPLLAAGAYQRIPPGRRHDLHRHGADVADTVEERARHLALASTGPDIEVAASLDAAARAARMRGAPESAAELAAHASRLTPPDDSAARDRRTMDRADYLYLSADETGARDLADQLLDADPRGATRVRALVLRALMDVDPRTAVARLDEAAAEPHDDAMLRARTLAQRAWQRGAWLGDVETAIGDALLALDAAEAVGDDPALLTALTTVGLMMSLDGRAEAEGHFLRALEIFDRVPVATGDHAPGLAYAHERWWRGDFATAARLLSGERLHADRYGDEGHLMRLDILSAEFEMRRGAWDEAERLLEAGLVEARGYWRITALVRRATLRARRGEPAARADAAELLSSPVSVADPIFGAVATFVDGLMDLADGRPAGAALRMSRLSELSDLNAARRAEFADVIPETVAALLEAGLVREAEDLTAQLERRHAQLAPWGTAAAALCRGQIALAAGRHAEARERLAFATVTFAEIGCPWELAQSLLAQGRTLQRIGRRREAAVSLERAMTLFAELRAEPALRATTAELQRARPRPRHDDSLTAAETRVAALVAAGNTNREVAARLFTTVATVEAHLTRIYSKLGARSRTELARRIADGSVVLDPRLLGERGR